jgi:hypothetical protein
VEFGELDIIGRVNGGEFEIFEMNETDDAAKPQSIIQKERQLDDALEPGGGDDCKIEFHKNLQSEKNLKSQISKKQISYLQRAHTSLSFDATPH